jgi:hypothetical protein
MNQVECAICNENISDKVVNCSACEEKCCRKCFQKYLMHITLKVSCMFCKANLTNDYIIDNTYEYWYRGLYAKYKANLLYEIEQARFQHDQNSVELYINAKNEIALLDKIISSGPDKIIKRMRKMRNAYFSIIKNYGKTDVDYAPTKKRTFIKACPNTDCKGFLSDKFICGLCKCSVCKDCHEILQDNHTCEPALVMSINNIKAEAHSCPSCATLISKIDGCDQMWCTQCHTTFSWRTGAIEKGVTHNPHYYQWMRMNGGMPRTPGDYLPNQCNQRPVYWDIYDSFDKQAKNIIPNQTVNECTTLYECNNMLLELYRYMDHVNATIIQPVSTDPVSNFDLRVRYMAKEIDIEKFKALILQRDAVWQREQSKRLIYDTVYQASGDLFRNLIAKQSPFEVVSDFKRLFIYGNECLRQVEDRYKCRCEKFMFC